MPFLVVQGGPRAGTRYPLAEENVVLGRGPGTIQVEDKAASRRHAEIFRVGELCFIRDLGSKNGTFLNESRVAEEILKSGDRIRIGATEYRFVDEEDEGFSEEVRFGEDGGKGDTTFLSEAARTPTPGPGAGGEIRLLREVAQELTAIPDRSLLRRRVLEVLCRAVQAEFGYFFAGGAVADGFKGLAQFGDTSHVSVSRSILRHAQSQKRTVMTEDASVDERFKEKQSVILRKIHSVLCVPVGRGANEGFLYMGRDLMRRPFTPHEMELASLVGDMATLALEAAAAGETQQEMLLVTARTLVRALELREPERKGHSERVSAASLAIAKTMGLSYAECRQIQLAGLLHDIGRLVAPDDAEGLGPLGASHPEARHVLAGERFISNVPALVDLLPGVSCHHEKADGTGFPRALKNARIPVMGRVVAVANALDHLVTRGGPQGTGLLLKDALLELGQSAGKAYDTEVVRALLLAYRRGTLGAEILSPEPT